MYSSLGLHANSSRLSCLSIINLGSVNEAWLILKSDLMKQTYTKPWEGRAALFETVEFWNWWDGIAQSRNKVLTPSLLVT